MRYNGGYLEIFYLLTMCLCLAGCGIFAGSPRENIVFNYEPKIVAPPMSSDTTCSLIVTRFFIPGSLFESFVDNIQEDIKELLTSKGFDFAGQYDTYDQMTLTEKKNTDLVLSVNVNLMVDGNDVKWTSGVVPYKLPDDLEFKEKPKGTITVQGSVSLAIHEGLTNELLSIKNVSIKPITAEIPFMSPRFDAPMDDNSLFTHLLKKKNTFHSEVGKSMMVQYKAIMDTISDYLEPADIKTVMRSAKDLRMDKVH